MQFLQLLYAISTFCLICGAGTCDEPLRTSAWEARLFVNKENSCSRSVNAMYGVFVIVAL